MAALTWDQVGERVYETGVDHGVLYMASEGDPYGLGVAWNGLTAVTESPSGAEATPIYADNIKYLNLVSAEEFSATIEAYTYPKEWEQFDGLASPTPGVTIGQQGRKTFGLCYRTLKGNDVDGTDYGYKLHCVYGAIAAPSEKAYATVNDTPEAITFSWEISTTAVAVAGHKPTSILTIDSTEVDAAALEDLEEILYGTAGADPRLPSPGTIIAMFAGTITTVSPNVPAFDSGTNTITIPSQAGVIYTVNGEEVAAGPLVITEDTLVRALPDDGYAFAAGTDNDWAYEYTP